MTDMMDEDRGELFLTVNQNDFSNYTKIFFVENMTDQIDAGYDGTGFSLNTYPSIYSKTVDSNYFTSESGNQLTSHPIVIC